MISEWGKLLAKNFTEIAARDFQYPKVFKFVRTPSSNELPNVDTHLMNEDVIKVMGAIYPLTSYTRQEQVDNVQDDFFSYPDSSTFILSHDDEGNQIEDSDDDDDDEDEGATTDNV